MACALGGGFHYGWVITPECVPALLRLLDDPEAKVRTAAAKSLGNIEPAVVAALPRLVGLLEDGDVDCRVQAARAVWRLGQKKHGQVVPILRQTLKDPNATTRRAALAVLDGMGKDAADALPEIGACATEDPDPGVRLVAVGLLLQFGRPAIPYLVKVLPDTNRITFIVDDTVYSSRSEVAAQTLGSMGPDAKAAVPALQTLLRHSSADIRASAMAALQRIDPEQYPVPKAEPE